jgi:hypothetical protein
MNDGSRPGLEDYLDIFISPAAVFRRRSDGRFGQALVVFLVLTAALYFASRGAMEPIMNAEFQRSMAAAAKAGQTITPEQLEAGRKMAGTFGAVWLIVGTPLMLLLLGVAVWLAAKVVGVAISAAQGVAIATLAMFPKLLDSVSGTLQALFLDERSLNSRFAVSLGVGRFLNPDTAGMTLLAVVGRIDLFTLWITVLVGVGLRVMGKASTAQAAAAAAIVWIAGGLPTFLLALRAG